MTWIWIVAAALVVKAVLGVLAWRFYRRVLAGAHAVGFLMGGGRHGRR
jgi:hypothetical protein